MFKKSLNSILATPRGPAYYVQRKLKHRGLTPNSASKLIGVNQSTLSRFLNGGSLTPEMAVKLNKSLEMDIDTLFNLEAQRQAEKAKQLAMAS